MVCRTVDLATHAEHVRAVRVFEVDGEVVVDVAVSGIGAALPAAHAHRPHRMGTERPVRHVEVVNVLLHDVVAGEPGEVEPVPDLPLDIGPFGPALMHPESALVPVDLARHDVADRAVVNALHHGLIPDVVTTLRPGYDRETLLRRTLGRGDDGTDARRIHGHRLLHEDMLASLDRGREVLRAKRGRRGEQDEIHLARDHPTIGVESHEAAGVLHANLRLERGIFGDHAGEVLATLGDMVGEQIAERDKLDVLGGGEAVLGRAGAAAAATDQADADLLVGAGVDRQVVRQRHGGSRGSRGLEEFATGKITVLGRHGGSHGRQG